MIIVYKESPDGEFLTTTTSRETQDQILDRIGGYWFYGSDKGTREEAIAQAIEAGFQYGRVPTRDPRIERSASELFYLSNEDSPIAQGMLDDASINMVTQSATEAAFVEGKPQWVRKIDE